MLLRLILAFALIHAAASTEYSELLEIQPLPSNFLYSSFQFKTSGHREEGSREYDIFPRSLLQIAEKARTRSLHLRFSRGRWNQKVWGPLPRQGKNAGGTGIEVWAVTDAADATPRWTQLVNALSGLFCASMNYIDSTRTINPVYALKNGTDQGTLFYGVLPSETVCTENLTPFLKLLPCKGRAGISSLLTGHKLFDTDWSSMSVDLEFEGSVLTVSQTIDMVFDVERTIFASRNPIPGSQPSEDLVCAPDRAYTTELTCFPQDGRAQQNWSFTEIFGRPLYGRCKFVDETAEQLIVYHNDNARLVPHSANRNGQSSSYHLSEQHLNLQCSSLITPSVQQAPLLIQRSLTSDGSSLHGKLTIAITNNKDDIATVTYLTTLPWFLRPFLHTLHTSHADVIQDTIYIPSKDRIRPTHLEMILKVPKASTVEITFAFERTILRYAEYPPDANRGFDVP